MKRTEPITGGALGLLFRRYAMFCIVGGTGVAVDMGIIWLLASPSALGWNLSLSKVIAAEVAIFNNFLWNDLWTFRSLPNGSPGSGKCRRARLVRFWRFNLICAAGIGLSVLLLNAQVYCLHLNVYFANLNSIILVSVWNFLMNVKFGWNGNTPERRRAG